MTGNRSSARKDSKESATKDFKYVCLVSTIQLYTYICSNSFITDQQGIAGLNVATASMFAYSNTNATFTVTTGGTNVPLTGTTERILNGFTVSNNVFTAPEAGTYLYFADVELSQAAILTMRLVVDGTVTTPRTRNVPVASEYYHLSGIVILNAGSTVSLQLVAGSNVSITLAPGQAAQLTLCRII